MNREKSIVRVTVWGAVANVVLAVAKLVAGIVGRSAAMTADAIHSFSDLVSDVIVLVMVKVASRGNDKDHEYGHGKFETLATVAVALLLLAVGGKMLADGVSRIAGFFRGEQMVVPGMITESITLAPSSPVTPANRMLWVTSPETSQPSVTKLSVTFAVSAT